MDADGNPVTLIITTSPTPSAPATDLISTVFQSYQTHCPELLACPIIVVFDTYERVAQRSRLKKGEVTTEGAASYREYKENIKELISRTYTSQAPDHHTWTTSEEDAEYGSPSTAPASLDLSSTLDGRVTFIEAKERIGFGLAVRSALRAARTPYVWIHQHDWELSASIPLCSILDVMHQSTHDDAAPIRYVCLPSPRMKDYAASNHVEMFPELRDLTAKLRREVPSTKGPSVPLTPLFFWHDKPHVAERQHYLARVFPSRLAMSRGDFIEDTIGHRARDQMKEGFWAKWACWLYVPGDGKQACVRHLHGRIWKGDERHRAQIEQWRSEGKRRIPKGKAPVQEEAHVEQANPLTDQHATTRVHQNPG